MHWRGAEVRMAVDRRIKLETSVRGITLKRKKGQSMDRREFFKKSIAAGTATLGAGFFDGAALFAQAAAAGTGIPDLVAVQNGEPDVMFEKGIEALGGMKAFVKKDQTVVVKPNIGWDKPPELGANTNPLLVKTIVKHCFDAGAKKVFVLDHTCSNPQKAYKNSGIQENAEAAGGTVVFANDEKNYVEVSVPKATILKTTKVHQIVKDCDVLINVPVLKHHIGTGITIAMKNLMGVMWDRGFYHSKGLHECIAEFCLYRKPDLNVVDAYRVTMDHGPHQANPEDIKIRKALMLSRDIVAADAAAAKLFGSDPAQVQHIKLAHDLGIGNMNLDKLNIRKITV
jgi:uncharacterized protein (DUF362 family)